MLPELAGKLDGIAVRAPVPTGTVIDLVVDAASESTKEEVNDALAAAEGTLKGILEYSKSRRFHRHHHEPRSSCIFDSKLTQWSNGNLRQGRSAGTTTSGATAAGSSIS